LGEKPVFNLSHGESRSEEYDFLRTFFEQLRAPVDLGPVPGFYDRVCSRIEEMNRQSIWVPLIYSRFRWRVVTACLALALGTLSYVLAAGENGNDSIFSSASPQQQRDAVLTQIVTYRKPN
jgi:hypothetical protein